LTDTAELRSEGFAVAHTRAWLERAVIGLNLCPFARAPFAKGRVRIVRTDAADASSLLSCLEDELRRLGRSAADELETTLLVHPHALTDFAEYNDFLDEADGALAALGLEGELQVASFHPDYRFAGSAPDDIANATNRSPYPMLHLLRESSIDAAVDSIPDTESIYAANIETMRRLGEDGWARLQEQCVKDASG
jgi:hypothetical protein